LIDAQEAVVTAALPFAEERTLLPVLGEERLEIDRSEEALEESHGRERATLHAVDTTRDYLR
jgi:hypothetical protein